LATANLQTKRFNSVAVDATTVLVRYTFAGDANLNRVINIDDYGRIDANIPLNATGWFNGDFNYDGKINIDDYGVIDFNLPIQGAQFSTAASLPSARGFADGLSATAIPEPAVLSTLVFVCALARRSRRANRKPAAPPRR